MEQGDVGSPNSVPPSAGHSGKNLLRMLPNAPLALGSLSSTYQGDWSCSHCRLVTPKNTPGCRLKGLERDAQGGVYQIHMNIKHSRSEAVL